MVQANEFVHEFKGIRFQIDSPLAFEEVLQRLRNNCGNSTIPQVNEIAASSMSADEFEEAIKERFVGPSGFMLFSEIEHTRWIAKYGLNQRALRIILGNPLYAVTMLREDISAGLFVPVELLLVSNGEGSTLHYVKPSSLMLVTENAPLKAAAEKLDEKLSQLIDSITRL